MLAARLAEWRAAGAAAVLVEVVATAGSAPREEGARMLVGPERAAGTIGGGALEMAAIAAAREMLREDAAERRIDQPLGPEIGQCCGGRVTLRLRRADDAVAAALAAAEAAARTARPAVLLFGAGHVGQALARALAPLPLALRVIDQRADWLTPLTDIAPTVLTALPEAEIAAAHAGAAFAIMTHDHALDFLIAEAALSRGDAAYVGMIGSASKRATLTARLARAGVDAAPLICPVGAAGPRDKRPSVIAAATAAEIAAAVL